MTGEEEVIYFYCEDCGAESYPGELVDNDGSGKFNQCPRCGSEDLIEDTE